MRLSIKLRLTGLLFLFASAISVKAQITMKEVVEEVLQSNVDLKLVKSQAEAAKNLANPGQAGMLPDLALNGTASYSNNNTSLEFAGDLPKVEVDGAENVAFTASLGLSYTIFNGFGRVANLSILESRHDLTETQARLLSESLALEAVNLYLDALVAMENVQVGIESVEISKQRLERIQLGVQNGTRTRLEELNAQFDLNTDSTNLLSLLNELRKKKVDLNLLMNRDVAEELELSGTVEVPMVINLEGQIEKAQQSNSTLLLALIAVAISEQGIEQNRAARFPTLDANLGYSVTTSENGAGIILAQNTNGINAGLNLRYPLFSGGRVNNALKNAKLDLMQKQLEMANARQELNKSLEFLRLDYELTKSNIATQKTNLQIAALAMDRATKSYELGQISFTDFRQSQLNLNRSKNALNQSRFNLVRLSYQLKFLTGELIN